MKSKKEIFVSCDVESNGPIPGINSMLSFGAAALDVEEYLVYDHEPIISTFSVNLQELAGSNPNPKTMTEFWDKQPKAWEACRSNQQPVEQAMKQFVEWLNGLPGRPVFVGYPASYDFMFIHWYIVSCGLEDPFGFSALDMKSYAMAKLKLNFRETTKRNMPKSWFTKENKHTHIALDDAIEQAYIFLEMLKC
jgi:DNA polymerase III alpha subunit (gram-positive type)